MRRGDYRNYYQGHMDKIKGEGGGWGGRGVRLAWGGGMDEKGKGDIVNNYVISLLGDRRLLELVEKSDCKV